MLRLISCRRPLAIALLIVATAASAMADTKTWTGAVDDLWSTPGNWAGGVPAAGDRIVFNAAGMNRTNVNDLTSGIMFFDLTFLDSNYSISGNTIGLTDGINESSFSNAINAPIELGASQSWSANNLVIGGDVDLGVYTLSLFNTTVNGVISGSGDILSFNSTFNGNNLLSGTTTVQGSGNTTINGSQPNSPVFVNAGRVAGSGTVGTLTLTGSSFNAALLVPGGFGSTAVFSGADVQFINSTSLLIDVNGPMPGGGYDQLNVIGTVTLGSQTDLGFTLGFAPTQGEVYVIVNNDGADPIGGTFRFMPEGTILNRDGSQFQISYVGGTGNDVTLTCVLAAKTWTGAIDDLWSNPGNWLGGVPGTGDTLVFPASASNTTNTNDLAPGLVVHDLILNGFGYVIGGNAFGLTDGIAGSGNGTTINAPIALGAAQSWSANNLVIGGDVDLGVYTLSLFNTTVNGVISGSGDILSFNSAFNGNNLLSGTTTVQGSGNTTINGSQPNSPVFVNAGRVAGSGTVGTLTLTGSSFNAALLVPGGFGSTAVFSGADVQFINSTSLLIDINGPLPGSQHDQLNVIGTITLSANTSLGLTLSPSYTPARGQQFIIVNNDSTDITGGTFAALPEATMLNVGPYPFQITYAGETGNDIVLTSLSGDPLNEAPVAMDDSFNAVDGAPLVIGPPGVLDNDDDADMDSLEVVSFSPISAHGGTVSVDPDGGFTYTSAPFTGTDTFTYIVSDGRGGTDTATVTIEVATGPATATPTATPTRTATPSITPTQSATPIVTPFECSTPLPASACRQVTTARRARLRLRDRSRDALDTVQWQWKRGEGTAIGELGDPTTTTAYALCLFDGSDNLVFQSKVAAGAGWTRTGRTQRTRLTYRDQNHNQYGIRYLTLVHRGDQDNRFHIHLLGRGKQRNLGNADTTGNFPALSFPIAVAPNAIRAQLINSDGSCWEASYQSEIRQNEVTNAGMSRFTALADAVP